MSVLKGDYIGFSYNGVHSSDLGIVRTSNGSRFEESLLPTIQDKTAAIPGGDGAYYFGSNYTQRQFTVSFAFDSLTESQFAFLSNHFGDKKVHSLIFDERPYKTYHAKVTGNASIKYICFDESEKKDGTNARVYKGEGSIQFTCYQPFATCDKKYLDDYDNKNTPEWAEASGLLKSNTVEVDGVMKTYDVFTYTSDGGAALNLYNPGDKPADWKLELPFSGNQAKISSIGLEINSQKIEDKLMEFTDMVAKAHPLKVDVVDQKVVFDSRTGLIEGYYMDDNKNWIKSGNLYNESLSAGDFFKIPITVVKTPLSRVSDGKEYQLVVGATGESASFRYDYYYY